MKERKIVRTPSGDFANYFPEEVPLLSVGTPVWSEFGAYCGRLTEIDLKPRGPIWLFYYPLPHNTKAYEKLARCEKFGGK
jgi:hypothetical protein